VQRLIASACTDWQLGGPRFATTVVTVSLYEASTAYLISERDGRTTQVAAPAGSLSPSARPLPSVALESNLMSGVDLDVVDMTSDPPKVLEVSTMPACAGCWSQFIPAAQAGLDRRFGTLRFEGVSPQPGDNPNTKQLLRIGAARRNGNADSGGRTAMKIWEDAPNSINVMKVLWAADECGAEIRAHRFGGAFGGNDQKWYLDMNPNGVVPTIDDGGRVIWESNSAVRYLSARYAAAPCGPTIPASECEADRWMDWQLSTISESMRVVFWGLVRTPPEKRDMDGDQEGGRGGRQAVRPARCASWRPPLCRGPALHHGRHHGRLLSSTATTRSTSSALRSRTSGPGTTGWRRARPTPSTSWMKLT